MSLTSLKARFTLRMVTLHAKLEKAKRLKILLKERMGRYDHIWHEASINVEGGGNGGRKAIQHWP
jgi:hypothetical protein